MQVALLPILVLLWLGENPAPSGPSLHCPLDVPLNSEGTCTCLSPPPDYMYSLSITPDVQFLASVLPPNTDPKFFEHLRALDCSGVTVRALPEGSLAFPGVSAL